MANLRNFLRTHVKMATNFEALVRQDPRFEIVAPRSLAMVCFRLLPPPRDVVVLAMTSSSETDDQLAAEQQVYYNEANKELMELVNSSGQAYMTHAVVGGAYIIRFAVGATLTEERHVCAAWKLVQDKANELLRRGQYATLTDQSS